jgi:hypothetical protein
MTDERIKEIENTAEVYLKLPDGSAKTDAAWDYMRASKPDVILELISALRESQAEVKRLRETLNEIASPDRPFGKARSISMGRAAREALAQKDVGDERRRTESCPE